MLLVQVWSSQPGCTVAHLVLCCVETCEMAHRSSSACAGIFGQVALARTVHKTVALLTKLPKCTDIDSSQSLLRALAE